jgi:hypothetical protein
MSSNHGLDQHIRKLLSHAAGLDARTAREVQQALAALMKREETLSAVASTAVAIANVLSVSDVFAVAIERAQSLVTSDLAYLTVFDEATGRSSVRASIGVRSPEFNSAQVPLGFGVGGIVARTKRPFTTSDYLVDQSLKHLESADRNTASEGIRAMAAVPLFARDRLIAILFVADRRVRKYSVEEIAALESLGLVVAVAIENAKLFETKEAALADIKTAYESLRRRIATTERVANIHDQIAQILAGGGPYDRLIRTLASDLQAEIVLRDARGHWLAAEIRTAKGSLLETLETEVVESATRRSVQSGSLEPIAAPDVHQDHLLMAMAVGGDLYGTLAVFSERRLVGTERRMIERACHAAGLLLLFNYRRRAHELWERACLLMDCIGGRQGLECLRERAAKFHIDLERPAVIVSIACRAVDGPAIVDGILQVSETDAILSGEYGGHVVAMMPEQSLDELETFRARLNEWLDPDISLMIAAVPCAEPLRSISEAVERCLRILRFKTRAQHALSATWGDDDVNLLGSSSLHDLATYRDKFLGALLGYDKEHSTDLVGTLRQLVQCGMNLVATASSLGVHAKTISQRVQRISVLLGADWRDPEQLFHLQLALRIDRMLGGEAVAVKWDPSSQSPD